jgi:hypothetical protein
VDDIRSRRCRHRVGTNRCLTAERVYPAGDNPNRSISRNADRAAPTWDNSLAKVQNCFPIRQRFKLNSASKGEQFKPFATRRERHARRALADRKPQPVAEPDARDYPRHPRRHSARARFEPQDAAPPELGRVLSVHIAVFIRPERLRPAAGRPPERVVGGTGHIERRTTRVSGQFPPRPRLRSEGLAGSDMAHSHCPNIDVRFSRIAAVRFGPGNVAHSEIVLNCSCKGGLAARAAQDVSSCTHEEGAQGFGSTRTWERQFLSGRSRSNKEPWTMEIGQH